MTQPMRIRFILLIPALLFLNGCATSLVKKNINIAQELPHVKTIAVLPADIKVYRLTTGGVREEIDEWGAQAKEYIQTSLKKHLSEKYNYQVKFVEEDWLKKENKELWLSNRALFYAVGVSALAHSYRGANQFQTKSKNFDYTMGPETKELAELCGADALLFIYGVDHEATAGRKALWWWNFSWSVLMGTVVLPTNPSAMIMGLVDAKTGDLLIFKTIPGDAEYSYINKDQMEKLVTWFLKDFQLNK